MHTSRIRDIIRPHKLRIVQKDGPVPMRHQNRVSVLRVYEAAVGEIRRVERARQSVPRQGCQERSGAVGDVAVEEAWDGGEGCVGGADAGETGGGVGAVRDVCSGEPGDEGVEVLGGHGVCLVDGEGEESMGQ